jgi:alpha-ribazole phosphatase
MHIYLIRHPQPLAAAGMCYGREDLGIASGTLAAAAASIRAQIPKRVLDTAEIFTSPSSRCLLLARELAGPREPASAADLAEMSFGSWEGKRWDSVPRDQLDAWAGDLWRYRPGGGESAALVARRWRRWSCQARGSAAAAVIAVTHAGFIRVALACAGRSSAHEFASGSIGFGSVHCIGLDERRPPSCTFP